MKKKPDLEKPDLGQIVSDFVGEADKPLSPPAEKKGSGFIPNGDVRLTANIRQDLHLKLKIAAAHHRTTIGEIIENLIDKHIPNSH